jgi:uncharacterized protein YbjT (DUF2867 family)
MDKPILVCGATGQVGAALGRALDERGLPWVGLSRQAHQRLGPAVARQGDFSNPASLGLALEGIGAVFLACGDHPQQDELEINMIRACRERGVAHIVKLSAQSAGLQPPVSFGRLHARSEQALRESGIPWTILRPVFFMQSLLFFAESIKGGKMIAATGAGRVAWVDVRDVAGVAAAALANPGQHAGRIHTLTGAQAASFADAATLLSRAAAHRVAHISPPVWVARLVLPLVSGMPRWQSNLAVELMAAIRRGAQEPVSTDAAQVLQRAPRTLDAFIEESREAFGGAPVLHQPRS